MTEKRIDREAEGKTKEILEGDLSEVDLEKLTEEDIPAEDLEEALPAELLEKTREILGKDFLTETLGEELAAEVRELSPGEEFLSEPRKRKKPSKERRSLSFEELAAEVDLEPDTLRELVARFIAWPEFFPCLDDFPGVISEEAPLPEYERLAPLYDYLADNAFVALVDIREVLDFIDKYKREGETVEEYLERRHRVSLELEVKLGAPLEEEEVEALSHFLSEEELEEILAPRYSPIRAKNLVFPNTLFAQSLPAILNKGETTLTTGRRSSKTPLFEVVSATLAREVEGATIEGDYTLLHEIVFCAFLSLWLAGNNTITPEMIRRFWTQNFKAGITPASVQEITKALEDLECMKVKIDMREEAERRGWNLEEVEGLRYGENMLVLREVEVIIGGELKTGYSLIVPPAIWRHAQQSKQIVSKSTNLFTITNRTTGKRERMTTARAEIVFYLIRQISNMKSDLTRARKAYNANERRRKKDPTIAKRPLSDYTRYSHNIPFSSVFEKTGLEGKQAKTLLDYKSFIYNCLETWTPGEIKGYKILHDGRRKDEETGIEVLLD